MFVSGSKYLPYANLAAQLPVAGCPVTGCKLRYAPDQERQRYCPRSSCGQWYHEVCLGNVGFIKKSSPLNLQYMLSGTPGFDDDDLDEEYLGWLDHSMNRVLNDDDNCPLPAELLQSEDDWQLIQKLLWCAATPIVRGKEYGVAGNGSLVQEARAIVEEMMKQQPYWPNEDEVQPFVECEWSDWTRAFKCNRCGGII